MAFELLQVKYRITMYDEFALDVLGLAEEEEETEAIPEGEDEEDEDEESGDEEEAL